MARMWDDDERGEPTDRRTRGRTGRIALLLAVVSVALMLAYNYLLNPGGDLPAGESPSFGPLRPIVLLLVIGGIIASLTTAAVSLSESNRSRLAPFLALMISIGLLFAFVTGMV